MRKIIQLDESLANLIAAGEVVENMASVVKELTENALDANSNSIEIHLYNHGLEAIKVIDDGDGIAYDDLPIAFKRHATSKIKTHHDLFHIVSLGFRGEALPSIAGVSEMVIESTEMGETGRKIAIKNGQIIEDGVSSLKKGTIVTVKKLFYNTPARLKHLKSEQRELALIVEYVHKFALAFPKVRFLLYHEGKTLLSTSGDGDIRKILYQIYDLEVVKEMLYFEGKHAYFTINGYMSKPTIFRSNRQHMILITNHRIIKNNALYKAIIEGYRSYLPIQKYPIMYLNIEVDPLLIDVNIHPQKLEIKFIEENILSNLIINTITNRLAEENLIHQVKLEPTPKTIYPQLNLNQSSNTPLQIREEIAPILYHETDSQHSNRNLPELEYIGQLLGTYLLFQNEEGLHLVDQHAAAERIRYENYLDMMMQESHLSKPLLIPLVLHLSKSEIINYQTMSPSLSAFGLKTILTEDNQVKISEVPSWFLEGHEEIYAEIMMNHLLDGKTLEKKQYVNQVAINLACKHSIKANHFLTQNEINHLMKDLNRTKNPYHCPHGRPTIIKLTKNELEKMFQRIQS